MNSIYSITPSPTSNGVVLDQIWAQGADGGLAAGYTSLVPVQICGGTILFAYNKNTRKTDAYALRDRAPWVVPVESNVDLAGEAWDSISTFVLGNNPYLLTYSRDTGTLGFFRVADDLSVSKPYTLMMARNTPTKGFTTVAPYISVAQQYVLGYDFDTGIVANYSVMVTPHSADGVPPLLAQNVWYHQWAKGWTHFAFFQLGGCNFFFKINTAKLNVNIDHMQDNPAAGSVEVGSYLQSQLPDALAIDIAAALPWADGEPYVLTYIASSGVTAINRIHADCLGWTQAYNSVTVPGASLVIPYRVDTITYALFYGG